MKLILNEKIKQINFLDERFYGIGEIKNNEYEKYYPSSTHILDVYPKGAAFIQWLKDVGNQAKYIAERASESGTKVHNAAYNLILGETICFDDKLYNIEEWNGILRIKDFYSKFIKNHCVLISKTEAYSTLSEGRYQELLIQEIEEHQWFTMEDEKVRKTHTWLHLQIARVGDYFLYSTGDLSPLRYPGDITAVANETANCRCYTVAVLK